MPTSSFRALSLCAGVLLVLTTSTLGEVAEAAGTSLSITPIEWNVVGLDSNAPATGPSSFSAGALVCNNGTTTIADATTTWVWDSTSTAISLSGAATKTPGSLAPGACRKLWYAVNVVPVAASFDQTRRFHITASATGAASVSTPTPREIYVERLVSQNRNAITGVTGPSNVLVGGTYTYTVSGKTAPGGYGQVVVSPFFNPSLFEILSVSEVLTVGGPSTTFYTDACGWVPDPTSTAYRSCTGSGTAGGVFTATVTARVVGAGTSTIRSVIYDFSGSSYHYNSDYALAVNAITVTATAPPVNRAPVAVNDTITIAQASPATVVPVRTNDSDPDSDPLTVTAITQPTNGTAVLATDGSVSYTPNPTFSGTDTFTYTISDGRGGLDTATITITVTPPPPPPPPATAPVVTPMAPATKTVEAVQSGTSVGALARQARQTAQAALPRTGRDLVATTAVGALLILVGALVTGLGGTRARDPQRGRRSQT